MSTPAAPLAPRLPGGLYALCDDSLRPELEIVEKARLLLLGGVRVLQLRLKRTTGRSAVTAALAVRSLCGRHGALCIVNDRVDWALLSDADGVHLGAEDLPPEDARALLGHARLVGVTTRSLEDILAAQAAGADHVGLGPVFETSTKQLDAPALGLQRLREICARSPLPIVAIAGITTQNIEAVAAAGAHAAAVGADLFRTDDIPARVRALAEAFARGSNKA